MPSLVQLAKIAFFVGSVAAAPGQLRPRTIEVRQAPPPAPPPAPGAPPAQGGLTDIDILQL
jgi:hypothetical protein